MYLLVADPGRLAVPLVEDLVQMLAFCVADGGWLGRTERLDRVVWVAAELGVGGNGKLAGPGGDLFPFLPAGHRLGEGLFSLLVEVVQGAVAGGQMIMAGGAVLVAGLACGIGFGGGTDGGQAGVDGGEPG